MDNIIYCIVWIWNQISQIWQIIYDYKYSFYIAIVFIIILAPFLHKIKNKLLLTIVSTIYALSVIIFAAIIINWVYDGIKKYQTNHPYEQTQQKTDQDNSSTETAPEIYGLEPELEDNYQYNDQTTKQLYYSVSCSGCYAEGCPSNGYIYNGYDGGQYAFYYGLCQSCSCTSVVGHSFWK